MKLAIIGGDGRMAWAGEQLRRRLGPVFTWGLGGRGLYEAESPEEALAGAGLVLLPHPACREPGWIVTGAGRGLPLEKTLAALEPGTPVLAGLPDPALAAFVKARGGELWDYGNRPEILIPGAAATAEGALAELVLHTPGTLRGSRVLILGAGRVGLRLLRLLEALGAEVSIAARDARDREKIAALGWTAADPGALEPLLPGLDALVNTVPAPVLGERQAALLSEDCLYLELASAPGGLSREALVLLGGRVLRAPGLPGRTAPRSAGEAVARAVLAMLKERGIWNEE